MSEKCPVCKSNIKSSDVKCPTCGFADLHKEFITKEDGELWVKNVVEPYKKQYEASKKPVLDDGFDADEYDNEGYNRRGFYKNGYDKPQHINTSSYQNQTGDNINRNRFDTSKQDNKKTRTVFDIIEDYFLPVLVIIFAVIFAIIVLVYCSGNIIGILGAITIIAIALPFIIGMF